MSRYPKRIPSRPTRQIQENKPSESASDLFKDVWDMNSKPSTIQSTCEDYIRNLSVKNRDYTIPTYRNTTNNTFSAIVKNEDIKEIRLVEGYIITNFAVEASNRVEFFYTPTGKKVSYNEITKVNEIQPSQYSGDPTNQLKKIGFNEFYQLYKYDYELRREVELCQMAVYRG